MLSLFYLGFFGYLGLYLLLAIFVLRGIDHIS